MRILIAGLGAIGQRHARNLRALRPDTELIAFRRRQRKYVITDRLERDDSRDVEKELGITAFGNLDEALATQPEAVFICTPSSQHLEIAQRAANADCHLFIEKPVSHTMDGLAQLQETTAARQLVTFIASQWRFHPCVRALRELLQAGTLGAISSADFDYAEFLPDWHPYEDYRASYAARADLGGGVVLTQIHDYDLAFWLFGAPRSVRATGGHLSALDVNVEDTVDATLDMNGCPVRVRQTFATRPPRRSIVVRGEKGTAVLDLLGSRLTTTPVLAREVSPADYQRNTMFRDEVAQFLQCLEQGVPPAIPLADGVAVLKIALSVKEAITTGRTVELL